MAQNSLQEFMNNEHLCVLWKWQIIIVRIMLTLMVTMRSRQKKLNQPTMWWQLMSLKPTTHLLMIQVSLAQLPSRMYVPGSNPNPLTRTLACVRPGREINLRHLIYRFIRQGMNNLLQCFTASIVHSCQQYCSALLHWARDFKLRAPDFYEVIANEGEARINYHLIEIESE